MKKLLYSHNVDSLRHVNQKNIDIYDGMIFFHLNASEKKKKERKKERKKESIDSNFALAFYRYFMIYVTQFKLVIKL